MSNELLHRLEQKVDNAVETIELLRIQVEELEEAKKNLEQERASLKDTQQAWEQNLNLMLDKLEGVEAAEQAAHKQAEEATQE